MKKPLSEIEAELYEVLASKELSRGCRIKAKRRVLGDGCMSNIEKEDIVCVQEARARDVFVGTATNWSSTRREWIEDDFVIIGHEPTLNDVLLRLGKMGEDVDIHRMSSGSFELYATHGFEIVQFEYDLTKSFDSQTPDTKRKLHSLICVK